MYSSKLVAGAGVSGSSSLVGSLVYCESTPSVSLISVTCSGNLFACLGGGLAFLLEEITPIR
jgi:hypothetical protein